MPRVRPSQQDRASQSKQQLSSCLIAIINSLLPCVVESEEDAKAIVILQTSKHQIQHARLGQSWVPAPCWAQTFFFCFFTFVKPLLRNSYPVNCAVSGIKAFCCFFLFRNFFNGHRLNGHRHTRDVPMEIL